MGKTLGGVDWGRIPPERRGRWGRWLYLERWNAGRQTQDSVRDTLEKMGHPISPSYYSEIESGKKTPNADWQETLTRLWGTVPQEEPAFAADTADVATFVRAVQALEGAVTAQTDLLRELLGVLRAPATREAAERLAVAAVAEAAGSLDTHGAQAQSPSDEVPASAQRGTR